MGVLMKIIDFKNLTLKPPSLEIEALLKDILMKIITPKPLSQMLSNLALKPLSLQMMDL